SVADTLDRLDGLYGGDLELKVLPRARADLSEAVLRAAGPSKKSKDQTDITVILGEQLGAEYARQNYDMIDAATVVRDLGIGPEKAAVAQLGKLLPPVNILVDGIRPEDPRIGALLVGLSINRVEYDLVYSVIAARVAARRKP